MVMFVSLAVTVYEAVQYLLPHILRSSEVGHTHHLSEAGSRAHRCETLE